MSSIRWERLVQGIQQFEKYKILLAEAKAKGNTSRVKTLEKLLKTIEVARIADESEKMVNGFRSAINAM